MKLDLDALLQRIATLEARVAALEAERPYQTFTNAVGQYHCALHGYTGLVPCPHCQNWPTLVTSEGER